MLTVPLIGLPVAATTYAGAVDWILEHAKQSNRTFAVEAANTHVAALARSNKEFGEAMERFDLICPDGMPLVWLLNSKLDDPQQKLTDRVYGPTLMLETLKATNQPDSPYRHFLLGGQQSTLDKLRSHFSEEFPNASIAGVHSPPFGEWPEDEFENICRKIKESRANLIWVGLGCPKQELWIAKYKDLLPPGVYFGIGAAFAFHAGEVRQAPSFLQKLGLEWAYRVAMEPRRLFRRYFTYNSLFLFYSLRDHMRG
ncbi:WecB/TagA/CpsF family glycosyltransferase [Luteolibacter pohnpeiensis]|uniref:WecB/TagA/CpsF family glycosyltransferase n=1 Tax=Luteolibacter pohnpeiensis TaxID=454153 RepID=A0A934VYC6_9BACT|nr:WecB/TagA/CpsF family glycosyltransferase [Luteolibacter pohnpeiensis]MBK1884753.1 WecB/TagA/CpsF family glycosyltransferase [Luteolibacter pohnpeiensis]